MIRPFEVRNVGVKEALHLSIVAFQYTRSDNSWELESGARYPPTPNCFVFVS